LICLFNFNSAVYTALCCGQTSSSSSSLIEQHCMQLVQLTDGYILAVF
jgi:hypothetical protein